MTHIFKSLLTLSVLATLFTLALLGHEWAENLYSVFAFVALLVSILALFALGVVEHDKFKAERKYPKWHDWLMNAWRATQLVFLAAYGWFWLFTARAFAILAFRYFLHRKAEIIEERDAQKSPEPDAEQL